MWFTTLPWLEVIGRLMIVAFFGTFAVLNGTQKPRVEDHIKRLGAAGAPFPALLFWCGIALDAMGCVLLLTDFYPAIGAACLIVFTLLATALLLRFWEAQPPQRNGMFMGFMNNVAITGGLLLLLRSLL